MLIRNKVAAFIITGGQDNVQAVAGQMLMFFSELGFDFPQFPFIAHSRGWSAEDMERNVTYVMRSPELREGARALARARDREGGPAGRRGCADRQDGARGPEGAPDGGSGVAGAGMAISIVQLGSPRGRGRDCGSARCGARHAACRKRSIASRNFYDVWLPELAPSEPLVKAALAADSEKAWQSFVRRYRAEMKQPAAARLLDLLAGLSHTSAISVGCYCADEQRCHRSVLRAMLRERGAAMR